MLGLLWFIVTRLLLLLAVGFVAFYLYRRFYVFRHFKRMGLQGPTPHWLFGNLHQLLTPGKKHLIVSGWTQKYGKMYGYFEGPTPLMVIADVHLVEQIFVKQFSSFHGRKMFPFQPHPDSKDGSLSMFMARGSRWKRLRMIINPTFSTSKLKALFPLVKSCLNDFLGLVDGLSKERAEFNIHECYKFLTLDTISECAFGIELASVKTQGRDNPILNTIKTLFNEAFNVPLIRKIGLVLPESLPVVRRFIAWRSQLLGSDYLRPRDKLAAIMDAIINDRRQNPEKRRQDILQTMLELEDPNAVAKALKEEGENGTEGWNDVIMKGLTHEEIKGQSVLFMIAGMETSSTTLGLMSYLLARNLRVQEKLREEILQRFPDSSVVANYDSVHELKYLDCAINETLRVYPISLFAINRLTMEEANVDGVHIPAGTVVQIDSWTIHYDQDLWGPVDPQLYYPERFLDDYPTTPGRNKAAFLPFGFGPRICLGMRFAYLEIKLAMVEMLRKYRICDSPRNGETLELDVAGGISPKRGIWVKLEPLS